MTEEKKKTFAETVAEYKKTAIAIITTLAAAIGALAGYWNEIKAALGL